MRLPVPGVNHEVKIHGSTNAIIDDVATIVSSIDTVTNTISSLSQDSENLKNKTSTHDEGLSNLDDNVAAILSSIDTVTNTISNLTPDVENLKNKTSTHDEGLSNLGNDVAAILSSIDTANDNISNLSQASENLKNKTSTHDEGLSNLDDNVADILSSIDTANDNISNLSQASENLKNQASSTNDAINDLYARVQQNVRYVPNWTGTASYTVPTINQQPFPLYGLDNIHTDSLVLPYSNGISAEWNINISKSLNYTGSGSIVENSLVTTKVYTVDDGFNFSCKVTLADESGSDQVLGHNASVVASGITGMSTINATGTSEMEIVLVKDQGSSVIRVWKNNTEITDATFTFSTGRLVVIANSNATFSEVKLTDTTVNLPKPELVLSDAKPHMRIRAVLTKNPITEVNAQGLAAMVNGIKYFFAGEENDIILMGKVGASTYYTGRVGTFEQQMNLLKQQASLIGYAAIETNIAPSTLIPETKEYKAIQWYTRNLTTLDADMNNPAQFPDYDEFSSYAQIIYNGLMTQVIISQFGQQDGVLTFQELQGIDAAMGTSYATAYSGLYQLANSGATPPSDLQVNFENLTNVTNYNFYVPFFESANGLVKQVVYPAIVVLHTNPAPLTDVQKRALAMMDSNSDLIQWKVESDTTFTAKSRAAAPYTTTDSLKESFIQTFKDKGLPVSLGIYPNSAAITSWTLYATDKTALEGLIADSASFPTVAELTAAGLGGVVPTFLTLIVQAGLASDMAGATAVFNNFSYKTFNEYLQGVSVNVVQI